MEKLAKESSLPGKVRILEQLMRDHIAALESPERNNAPTSTAPTLPAPPALPDKQPTSVTSRETKLGIDGEAPRKVIKRKGQVKHYCLLRHPVFKLSQLSAHILLLPIPLSPLVA